MQHTRSMARPEGQVLARQRRDWMSQCCFFRKDLTSLHICFPIPYIHGIDMVVFALTIPGSLPTYCNRDICRVDLTVSDAELPCHGVLMQAWCQHATHHNLTLAKGFSEIVICGWTALCAGWGWTGSGEFLGPGCRSSPGCRRALASCWHPIWLARMPLASCRDLCRPWWPSCRDCRPAAPMADAWVAAPLERAHIAEGSKGAAAAAVVAPGFRVPLQPSLKSLSWPAPCPSP